MGDTLQAVYWIETPFPVEKAAEVLAGEQSCGTFVRVAGETDALRQRHRARVEAIEILDTRSSPSLPGSRRPGEAEKAVYTQARVTVRWPLENMGLGLPNVLATVAGNLFELSEFSGLKLLELHLPAVFGERYPGPRHGVPGTRGRLGRATGPMLGTIIKPSVGMDPEQTAARVSELIEAGLDFIKDDELMADPPHCPFRERVRAVMGVIRRFRDRTGRQPMYAFNLSGSIDEMKERHDLVREEEGSCVMASLHWVGGSAIEALAGHSSMPIHGHRNGWGLFYRSPAIGVSYPVMQQCWRLWGVDHLHCNGLRNKFAETDESVIASARACLTPLFGTVRPAVPVIASGQWAEQAADTHAAVGSADLLYLCGGGIVGHPDGVAAGVTSVRQAWDAALSGRSLEEAAREHAELRAALSFFGRR